MRERQSLNGLWEYRLDPEGKGIDAKWHEKILPGGEGWKICNLPSAVTLLETAIGDNYKGDIWFWRRIMVSKEMLDRYLELCIDLVNPSCEIYLEGKLIHSQMTPGKGIRIRLPKTIAQHTPIGLAIRVIGIEIKPNTDQAEMSLPWFGILGDIYLQLRGNLQCNAWKINVVGLDYAGDVATKAKLELQFEVMTSFEVDVYAQLDIKIWQNGTEIFSKLENFKAVKESCNKISIIAEITNPKVWSPNKPDLYEMEVMVARTNQKQDAIYLRFGIRDIKADQGQLVCNQIPITITGLRYDPTYPGCGCNPPISLLREDFRRIKLLNINTIIVPAWIPDELLSHTDTLGLIVGVDAGKEEIDEIIHRMQSHPSVACIICKEEFTDNEKRKIKDARMIHMKSTEISQPDQLLTAGTGMGTILNIRTQTISGITTFGKLPTPAHSEEYQRLLVQLTLELMSKQTGGFYGVILGDWADQSIDSPNGYHSRGIVTSARQPKQLHEFLRFHQ
jgi:hypothetical protein